MRCLGLTPLGLLVLVVVAALLLVQPPAAAQEPSTATPDSDRYVVIGVLLWDKELGVEVKVYGGAFGPALPTATPMAATQAPAASDTPLATATSTPTATLTPTPSLTPSATATPTATLTATSTPTSTPSATAQLSSSTPAPTGVPECYVTISGTLASNLRAGPSTADVVIAKAQPGTRWRIFEVLYDDISVTRTDEWARVELADGRSAWLATYHNNQTLAAYDVTAGCAAVRWPGGKVEPTSTPVPTATSTSAATSGPIGPQPTPTRETAWGVLTTVGADKATVQKMIDIVQGAGREPALTVVMDASMAAAFDDRAYVIWRPWPDCPAMLDDVAASIRARLDYIDRVTLHRSFDALQLTNECLWPSPGYLNAWTLEALRQTRVRYPGKTIIPWVFAPGTFEPSWVPELHDALADMAVHGDLFGLNLYPARAGVPLSTRDAWTIWTTWRYEMIRALMEPGADPCFAVTEAGAGDGNMALTPGDAAAFATRIDGDACVVTLWGLFPPEPPGPWPLANLWDRVSSVFEAVRSALKPT